ncbi:MAG: hypothetical protein F7B06_09410 [Opitutae bacterium]|nr:hypothetical protein [Opitutae bacterium]
MKGGIPHVDEGKFLSGIEDLSARPAKKGDAAGMENPRGLERPTAVASGQVEIPVRWLRYRISSPSHFGEDMEERQGAQKPPSVHRWEGFMLFPVIMAMVGGKIQNFFEGSTAG